MNIYKNTQWMNIGLAIVFVGVGQWGSGIPQVFAFGAIFVLFANIRFSENELGVWYNISSAFIAIIYVAFLADFLRRSPEVNLEWFESEKHYIFMVSMFGGYTVGWLARLLSYLFLAIVRKARYPIPVRAR
ncbi:hypothetical protein [Roseibium sp. Sym1]|uniref:hypothetical protein n=1 Tax=Roseibium sp. Sym1 TaxID=3016006 RepID=UPI0022B2DCB4|nr:hypothetical protein [Roseibium sp. Sym1]